ncbi:peptide/nickel transport system substrate-binding protein [Kaistia soli DSM 19436]|uniref:Peptide/nickel transport system substrate-binding protein n=1 Tax=Kaistia soli DSM 19436 TaxID=1122133 RepID=A0A1M4WY15_9HYPH|nr:ABC transporter substrate-binding protein [Kaistia soli]SHE86098.1 peptide/nickel transport system substrate-binding protein [Kaistia soli DSM 19436]
MRFRALRAGLTATLLAVGLIGPVAGPALAATPKDTLVQAWQIDDIISLDPAELFEFSTTEIAGNTYERLIGYDLDDVSKMFGVVAESWTVSDDGKTISFKIREGRKFASGNPITAADVEFSLQRAVLLDKSPAFIITQFGITKDNVKDAIKATGDYTLDFTMDRPYAPSFALYALTSSVASVVDKKLVLDHEADADLGNGWLKTHYAGSGPFTIRDWRANEVVVLERNPNFSGTPTPLSRVIYRHIPETATQRILLEKGDVDIARNLGPEQITALSGNPDIKIQRAPKGTLYYLGLNQKNPNLAKPEVREALKYLVDYAAITDTIMKDQATVHQAFLPKGFLGAVNDTPFSLDVDKAKALLAKAGLPDGFAVTMDVRSTQPITGVAEAIQSSFAKAGVKVEIIPGDGKQTLTKYRARAHDIYIGDWGSDYQDPHSNAQTFASNPDNKDDASSKTLAWRNAWPTPVLGPEVEAAILERDPAKRAAIYEKLQRDVMADGPFVIMFQKTESAALRSNVKGFIMGPSFDNNLATSTSKD